MSKRATRKAFGPKRKTYCDLHHCKKPKKLR